ncbi:MAG TPA: calcium-binding protein, partial [Herbaspirillum sp.]
MANSKAQNAPASSRGNVYDKTNIKVVMPDANGDFTAPVAKSAVEKVEVVDVDMVLQLKDGTNLVLAGGAISAMDASHTEVKFSDGLQGLSNLFDLVGTIAIPKLEPILSSLQGQPNAEGQGAGTNDPVAADSSGLTASVTTQIVNQLTQIVQVNSQSVTIQTVDPTAQTAVLSQNTKTGDVDSQPLQHVEPPIPPERPGIIPPEHIIGPDAPAMTLTLVNLTTITQIGNVLYGSGGTPPSATDGSNNAQFAPQVINAPADATEIHAISNIPPNDFIKVVNITLTGNGIAQSIEVKGVPPGMSIVNGTDLGNGVWSIPVVDGQRDYAIQIEYTTVPADPQAPIHQQFSMEFDVTMTTADGVVNLSQVKQFVVKDVNTVNDLTYIDSTTGEGVYVLPAQGNAHVIHAGDAGVTIYGSNAADFLFGGAGVDTIHGGSGNTYFEGGGGADQLIGGTGGVNTAGYTLSTTGVTVDLLAGTGTGGDAQGDTLTNIQNVIGSTHDDIIISGTGANNINGGGGVDRVSYAGSATGVIVDLQAGTGNGGNATGDKLTGIQNVTGSEHNDTFFASSVANAFDGGQHDLGGADTVSYANVTTGGVIVDLSTGARTGGAAAGDTYTNIQNIIGTAFADTFIDGAGANRYDGTNLGAPGLDTVDYRDSDAGVNVDFVTGRGHGGYAEGDSYVNIQNVVGSSHDDSFTAASDSKNFNGGSGGLDTVDYSGAASGVIIDTIAGQGRGGAAGNTYVSIEKFVGSGSDDTFIASNTVNYFNGGKGGSDTVDYSNSNLAVTVDLSHADGTGNSGGYAAGDVLVNIANVIGSAHDDVFIAGSVQNSFEGGLGNNTVSYENSSSADSTGVTVDLSATDGSGTGGNYALGDKFSNIQNVIGSTFNDTFVASSVANVFTGHGGSDTVSYAKSTSTDAIGVTVDLSTVDGVGGAGHGSGDFAQGDTYIDVQNAIGSAYNDTFIAGTLANTFTGGGGSDTVSYAQSTAAVNVDLVNGVGTGGYAEGDQYLNIQNVIGSRDFDDTIIDNLAANNIDGGTGSLHNRVSYANSVSAPGVAAGVTVDLSQTDGSGTSGGYAQGDVLTNIQDLTGSAADDTFVASLAANNLDGGASTAASHNRVSYAASVDGGGAPVGVTVDLVNGTGSGGYAQGDTYVNIQDVTGSKADDLIIASDAANAIDGGTGSMHNRVSYEDSVTSTGVAAGVTIDLNLADGSGNSGGYATGDKLTNIQDLTGSAADDKFIASGDANNFDGGASTAASHNVVSYAKSATGVTVDLTNTTGLGT